jgi:hypothetical protein
MAELLKEESLACSAFLGAFNVPRSVLEGRIEAITIKNEAVLKDLI